MRYGLAVAIAGVHVASHTAHGEPGAVLVGAGGEIGTQSSDGAVLALDVPAGGSPSFYATARYDQLNGGQNDNCTLLLRGAIVEASAGGRLTAEEPLTIGGHPFIGLGGGVTHVGTSSACPGATTRTANGFLLEVPLGLDYEIGARFALRVQVRPVLRQYLSQTSTTNIAVSFGALLGYRF